MGIEYYLINNKTEEIYELGKGSWYALNIDVDLVSKDTLDQFFDDEIIDENMSEKDKKYWFMVAEQIWNFCKNADPMELIIINDSELDWYTSEQKYRFVGSRKLIES